MAPAPYATVRTHIYYGLIRYCMRDQQSRGHGLPWPQLDTIAITFLLSLSLSQLRLYGKSRLSSFSFDKYRLIICLTARCESRCESIGVYVCVCVYVCKYVNAGAVHVRAWRVSVCLGVV